MGAESCEIVKQVRTLQSIVRPFGLLAGDNPLTDSGALPKNAAQPKVDPSGLRHEEELPEP